MVKAGYVRHIGLSEVGRTPSAALRSASDQRFGRIFADLARHRGEILPTCRELGIGITPMACCRAG
jgi:aryl-alcohol dehydrogenase-like predicted oxidoreductase